MRPSIEAASNLNLMALHCVDVVVKALHVSVDIGVLSRVITEQNYLGLHGVLSVPLHSESNLRQLWWDLVQHMAVA